MEKSLHDDQMRTTAPPTKEEPIMIAFRLH